MLKLIKIKMNSHKMTDQEKKPNHSEGWRLDDGVRADGCTTEEKYCIKGLVCAFHLCLSSAKFILSYGMETRIQYEAIVDKLMGQFF